MKILVTGGAGFIASHLVDRLIELKHEVYVIDNLVSGNSNNLHPDAVFYKVNILDENLCSMFYRIKPDVVIHHAAQTNVQNSFQRSSYDANVNVLGTINVLEACRASGVKKIIYASTAAVYGTPIYLPIDEKHPVRPLSFYGISKYVPEQYLEIFYQLYNLDYTILRYANVYGIRQDPKGEGGVVSIFIDKLMSGLQPSIYGDGEQTRDFIYVKDVVEANIAALERNIRGTFNIGCNQQTSVNDLLKHLCALFDKPFAPVYKPSRPGDIMHSSLDNNKAIKFLGWSPRYTLYDGLRETCAYYKAFYSNSR
jgi:UDP-glucose 4-epimerase